MKKNHGTDIYHMFLKVFLKEKSWLIWKDPDAGKDWGQKEKGMTEY